MTTLGGGFFQTDDFVLYSTKREFPSSDSETVLRVFPNLPGITTEQLISLGIKNSYPTTGRIYGNYSPSSSSKIIIEHDYTTLEPGEVYCLNKFGGDKMSEYFDMHVLEGLDGEYRIGRVKFSEGRGVCEVRTYPSTIQYDYSKYVTSSVSLIDSSLSTQISSTLDVNMGVYGLGKILQRISLECVISYNSGSKLCVNEVIPYLDKLFKEIFLPKTSYFMYDTSIGGITTRSGASDHQSDFGNGIYNDHHYHYGYYLHAISLVDYVQISSKNGKDRMSDKYGRFFDGLANDVCNYDARSKWYSVGRHMDMYEGHSWASGVEEYAEGKGQESVSEAVNCYVGCMLWGGVRGDEDMERFGRVSAEIEVTGAKRLWQRPSGDMLGIVSSTALTSKTWFGDKPQYRHGINVMPITAVTPYLVGEDWASKEWKVLKSKFDGFEDEWKSILTPIVALHDPVAAREKAGDIKTADAGTSLGLVSWFIESMGGEPLPDPVESPETQENSGDDSAKCEKFGKCGDAGLTGYCCPTLEGLMLECCN
ncbi:hypothetical protein TrST_g6827 [Triparma strigata]|nr:hypothetical protein TrST_g6827 [Triparma strigata]